MNKVQDGFFNFRDSSSPLVVTADRKNFISIAIVGDKILLTPGQGSHIKIEESSGSGLVLSVQSGEGEKIRLGEDSLLAKPVLKKT